MDLNFTQLLDETFTEVLNKQDIFEPTEIQSLVIPKILEKKDVVFSSQTGSGKTLAYLLPIYKMIDVSIKSPQVFILTPTQELASQVYNQAKFLSKNMNNDVQSALLIGNANMKRQIEGLKQKPQIIIGSPGRILEIIRLKKLTGHYVKTIVIDEADRMFDDLNVSSVLGIIKTTLKDRQLILASASINNSTLESAKDILKTPEIISANKLINLPSNIENIYFVCERRDKVNLVRKIIHSSNILKALVFVNNKDRIEEVTTILNYHSIKSVALHGQAFKSERKTALEDFRTGKVTLLVASDIAARGLDIKGLTHIINIDVPEEPAFYLHRAGRTGRMGEKGVAITLATENEAKNLLKLEKKLKIKFHKKTISHGKF